MEESHFDKGYEELRKIYDEKFGKGKDPSFSRESLAFELTVQDLKEGFAKQYELLAKVASIGVK